MKMVSKRRKVDRNDGPVKIVGVNHGLCLHLFLLLDGWKKEQFTDVTFICHLSSRNQNQNHRENRLFANRSVLAAVSPFFASLLPEGELELDVCISVDWTFEDMFCVLEYIYSGKLLCSIQSKERILSILNDFGIFVPDNVQQQHSRPQPEDKRNNISNTITANCEKPMNIVVQTLQDNRIGAGNNASTSNSSVRLPTSINKNTENVSSKSKKLSTSNQKKVTQVEKENTRVNDSLTMKMNVRLRNPPLTYRAILPKANVSFALSSDITELPSHLKDHSYDVTTTTPPPHQESSSNLLKPEAGTVQTNEDSVQAAPSIAQFTLQELPDKEAVTLQLPAQFVDEFALFKGRNTRQINRSFQRYAPNYPLTTYFSDTWGHGIYSTLKPNSRVTLVDQQKNRTVAREEHSVIPNRIPFQQQPTSVISRPRQTYSRHKNIIGGTCQQLNQRNVEVSVVKRHPTQNTEPHTQKISTEVNGQQSAHTAQPLQLHHFLFDNVFRSDQQTPERTVKEIKQQCKIIDEEESNENNVDLMLAKYYFKAEHRRKRVLRNKIRRLEKQLAKDKEIARSILKRVRDFEKGKCGDYASKLQKVVKKSKPKKQCSECGKMVAAKHLPKHLKIHSGVKSHLCDLCGRTYVLRSYLEAHKRSHHLKIERPKIYKCNLCDHTTYNKNKLETHQRIHTNEKPFDCQYCEKKFREKGTLVRHIRTHTGEKPYVCHICGAAFAARETLVGHCKRIHEKKAGLDTDLPSRFSSKKMVKRCEFCPKTFNRVFSYEKHVATHTGVALAIRCSEDGCEFTYATMAQLRDHMASRHPEKTYTCAICSKVFLSKSNHDFHQAKHDNTLGFHCSFCPAIRTTKPALAAHETIHTRETPHECSYCHMRFHSVYLLNLHIRKEHERKEPKKRIRNRKPVEKQP